VPFGSNKPNKQLKRVAASGTLAERERLRLRPLVLKGWAISPYHFVTNARSLDSLLLAHGGSPLKTGYLHDI